MFSANICKLDCIYLVLGSKNKVGILLVYCLSSLPAGSLPDLLEGPLDLLLRTQTLIVLNNINAETALLGYLRNFLLQWQPRDYHRLL